MKDVLTKAQSIKRNCALCSGTVKAVAGCNSTECPLWPYRSGTKPKELTGKLRAVAIRDYCLWCCNDQKAELRQCPSKRSCTLWPHRFGYKTVAVK